jgi:hypothetical protein
MHLLKSLLLRFERWAVALSDAIAASDDIAAGILLEIRRELEREHVRRYSGRRLTLGFGAHELRERSISTLTARSTPVGASFAVPFMPSTLFCSGCTPALLTVDGRAVELAPMFDEDGSPMPGWYDVTTPREGTDFALRVVPMLEHAHAAAGLRGVVGWPVPWPSLEPIDKPHSEHDGAARERAACDREN